MSRNILQPITLPKLREGRVEVTAPRRSPPGRGSQIERMVAIG